MRKYICLFICMVAFLALLTGCKIDDNRISAVNTGSTEIGKTSSQSADITDWNPSTYETINNFDGVTMTVKKETAASTGLTVVIENNSGSQCTYGEYFELEKKINEIWYKVPVTVDGDYGFDSIGYELSPGDCREWAVDWNWLYGSLEPGKYRIVKDILDFRGTGDYDTYYLASEFTIFTGSRSNSVGKGKKINSIEIIRQSDKKEWILSDEDIVDKFTKALNDRQKTNSKIDIRPHDYSVKIYFTNESNKEYRLWIDEDINIRGVLMNEDTTWFINKESNAIFKEILK
jgi:hypothetical protein